MRPTIEAEYECPHCGAGYSMGDDAIYTDHVSDGCALQCEDCGGWYQLQCESVEVHLAATAAPAEAIPASKASTLDLLRKLRQSSGNAWDDVTDVSSEIRSMR